MSRHVNEVPLNTVVNEDKPEKCPSCGATEFDYEDGERYCKKCGYVFE